MKYSIRFLSFCLASFVLLGAAKAQNEVTLVPTKDNTLFESGTGSLSNGAGDFLFIGQTASGAVRRALLAFDLTASIPGGSTILSAELTLRLSKEPSGDGARNSTLHRVLADWGEGSSDSGNPGGGGTSATTGDATWIHTSFDTEVWGIPGGDFETSASASLSVDDLGTYTWTSAQMAADVQAWLDDPASSFGWILLGDEVQTRSARRFDSKDHPVAANRPSLRVTFDPPAVAVEERPGIPTSVTLRSTYPNPFADATTVQFEVSEPGVVNLEVYDMLGRKVETLADGWYGSGNHELTFVPGILPAGTYFFRLTSGATSMYRQAVLFR